MDLFDTVADAEAWSRRIIDQRAAQSQIAGVDLAVFCSRESGGKYDFTRPFVSGGKRYATNGRVCLRLSAPDTPDTAGNFPLASGLPWPTSVGGPMLPWPSAEYVWAEQDLNVVEPVDDGGDADDDDDPVYIWMPQPHVQPVGTRMVASTMHYIVSRLTGVQFQADGGPTDAVYFTFDGGEGLLMPVSREDE